MRVLRRASQSRSRVAISIASVARGGTGHTALVKNSVELRKIGGREQPAVREGRVASAVIIAPPLRRSGKAAETALSNGTYMRVDAAADGSLKMPAIPAVARQGLRCARAVLAEAA